MLYLFVYLILMKVFKLYVEMLTALLCKIHRKQRMEEMKAAQQKARYGDVCEISREDYVREVNQAGEGISVILLVYKPSLVPFCCVALIRTKSQ